MFSYPKILFLVSLLFIALLNSIPTYLLNFKFFILFVYLVNQNDVNMLHDFLTLIVLSLLYSSNLLNFSLLLWNGPAAATEQFGKIQDHVSAEMIEIKTHNSESRGQEEAGRTRQMQCVIYR